MSIGNQLVVLLDGRRAGVVELDARRGRTSFTYDSAWRDATDSYPLSLSMPLAAREYEYQRIEPFMWGLLPDNEVILDRWAQRYQVSARNAFALLTHTGMDCPGAVQFVRPEVEQELQRSPGSVDWLEERQVEERLRLLRANPGASRLEGDTGQFSLGGAQPKTALLFQNGRWGVPSGRIATTHIVKPPIEGLDGQAENEHLCLALLAELGVSAARSEIHRFGEEVAIVVERFDRIWTSDLLARAEAEVTALQERPREEPAKDAAVRLAQARQRAQTLADRAQTQPLLRIHQEDLCQAFAVPPSGKYQNNGGPDPERIVRLLRENSSRPDRDVTTFVNALIFNYLVAGTDAHAKNYALLLTSGGQVRMAPLYDVASALPYPQLNQEHLKLAMKIGSNYRLRHIGPRDWDSLSRKLGLDSDQTLARVAEMAEALSTGAFEVVRERARQEGLLHPVIDRLAAAFIERADHIRTTFSGSPSHG